MRLLVVALCGVLGACSATGQAYRAPPVNKNSATIVVYRESDIVTRSFSVEVNGELACDLHSSGYFVTNRTGDVTISAAAWDMPGTSRLKFKADKGGVYYVNISMGSKRYAAVLGLVGLLAAEGVSSSDGPFDIELVDGNTAKKLLPGLKENCHAV